MSQSRAQNVRLSVRDRQPLHPQRGIDRGVDEVLELGARELRGARRDQLDVDLSKSLTTAASPLTTGFEGAMLKRRQCLASPTTLAVRDLLIPDLQCSLQHARSCGALRRALRAAAGQVDRIR